MSWLGRVTKPCTQTNVPYHWKCPLHIQPEYIMSQEHLSEPSGKSSYTYEYFITALGHDEIY